MVLVPVALETCDLALGIHTYTTPHRDGSSGDGSFIQSSLSVQEGVKGASLVGAVRVYWLDERNIDLRVQTRCFQRPKCLVTPP